MTVVHTFFYTYLLFENKEQYRRKDSVFNYRKLISILFPLSLFLKQLVKNEEAMQNSDIFNWERSGFINSAVNC